MSEYPKKRYGAWSGRPKGHPYNPDHCAYEVWGKWLPYQCSRKKGYGDNGLFCKQHANIMEQHNAT